MFVSRRWIVAGTAAAVLYIAASIVVAEGAMHVSRRPQPEEARAIEVASAAQADWQAAELRARDGAVLRGWAFTPRASNGAAVILLHGVGDSRRGVLGHATYLAQAGFTVLTPDARSHGASGGGHITYGIEEARDVHEWADWLLAHRPVARLYGMGESMGAAVMLESLAVEPRLRAVVAECPFDTFADIAYDRMGQVTGLPRAALWGVLQIGYGYVGWKYGIDLHRAWPLAAVKATAVPVLLIHGMDDRNIPYRHSVALHAANPRATTLWLVPGAGHTRASDVQPEAYERRVVGWFREH